MFPAFYFMAERGAIDSLVRCARTFVQRSLDVFLAWLTFAVAKLFIVVFFAVLIIIEVAIAISLPWLLQGALPVVVLLAVLELLLLITLYMGYMLALYIKLTEKLFTS
jgi:hypothetical protein